MNQNQQTAAQVVDAAAEQATHTEIGNIRIADIAVAPDRMRALRPDVVDGLAESISKQGLLQPIIVRPRGKGFLLVVGHHRLAASGKLGRDKIEAKVLDGLDADSALLAEIDENLIRADLSAAERALHQGERKRLYEKLHPETRHGGDRKSAETKSSRQNGELKRYTKDAAKKTGKSERSVQREVERANKIVGLADVVGTSLDAPDELDALAKLPAPTQTNLIARAKAGSKVTARHEAKLQRRKERERELAAATIAASQALGEKLYGLLYIDWPWRYDNPPMGDVARANENHYQTMSLDDIKAFKLPAAPDVVVFMWATVPLLDAAMEVLAAHGLKHKSATIWEKDRTGTGYWVRGEVEILLIATRGNVPAPAPGEQFPALVRASRGRHSEKPDIFADMIARAFPNVPKLEMFARIKERPGWDVWGNEASAAEPDDGDLDDIPTFLRRTEPVPS